MRFVYPEFLYALTVLAVPILIHLFNFRRYKKIYFSNIQLLKEVKEQTQSRSRLKHLLVLLARLLALTCLVLAFAQPIIPGNNSDQLKGGKHISIYLDNSFSMEAEGKNGRLLDFAKQKAIEVADEYAATDKFQLVTNDFEAYQQRLVSKEECIEMIQDVQLSPSSRKLDEVLSRQLDVLNQVDGNKRLIWISDFQKSTANISDIDQSNLPPLVVLPVQAEIKNNVYIDSIWFDSPVRQLGVQEKLKVRIVNNGDQLVENAPLYLYVNGKQKAISNFSVDAGSFCDSTLYFTNTETGVQQGEVKISDAHVLFDDTYYFSYVVQPKVFLLNVEEDKVNDTLGAINRLFRKDNYFVLSRTKVTRIDYAALPKNNLVIFSDVEQLSSGLISELNKFINRGGSVLLFPSINADLNSINTFLTANKAAAFLRKDTLSYKTESLNFQDPFFSAMFDKNPVNIDLPQVKMHYTTEKRVLELKETILKLKNGDDFLYRVKSGEGNLFVSTVPLNSQAGNFSGHAIFVPIILRIAEWSQNSGIMISTIGNDDVITVPRIELIANKTFELVSSENNFSTIPELQNNGGNISLFVHGQINKAGNYLVNYDQNTVLGVGFNYNRSESNLSCFQNDELFKVLESSSINDYKLYENVNDDTVISIEVLDDSKTYWKLFLYLTLLFLLTEIALLRFMKN